MIKSLRNPDINYQYGWFFITTQVAHNKSIFGVIAECNCLVNALGKQIASGWRGLFSHHPETHCDTFIVMPNHFHGIVHIHKRPANKRNHLAYLMQGFKSYTTNLYHRASSQGICPNIGTQLWQPSFYDNLITTYDELQRIRAYIRNNPAQWEKDRFGPITTYYAGNMDLLNQPLIAYVASEGWSPARAVQIRGDDIELGRNHPAGPLCPVISTFTSPQELAVLAACHATKRPYVHVLPAGIPEELPAVVRAACDAGLALLLSPSAPGTRLNKQRAIWCNQYVLRHAREIWHGNIRAGGTLEMLLKQHQGGTRRSPPTI